MAPQLIAVRPGAAVLLLIVALSWSVDAAAINLKSHHAASSSSRRLFAVGSGAQASAERTTENGQIKTFPETPPGLMGIIHEGSKMGVPMHQQVALQEKWEKPTTTQTMFWAGTLVYAFFGIFIAYVYYQARVQYEKVFLPQLEPGVLPREGSFGLDLFSCLSDPKICVMGFCCPCLRWADTLDRQGVVPYWTAFPIMFFLILLSVHTKGIVGVGILLLGVVARQKLRARFDIENKTASTVMSDCMVWLCCQPCAIVQEAREEAVHRSMGGV